MTRKFIVDNPYVIVATIPGKPGYEERDCYVAGVLHAGREYMLTVEDVFPSLLSLLSDSNNAYNKVFSVSNFLDTDIDKPGIIKYKLGMTNFRLVKIGKIE